MAPRRPTRPEDALALAVVDRYLALRRGDSLTIEAWSHAIPWARALLVAARRRGVVPTLVVEDEEAYFRSIEVGGAPVASGPTRGPIGASRAHVYLGGPAAFPRLLGLPLPEIDRIVRRHEPSWWARARRQGVRAVRLAVAEATPVAASRYGVDLGAWQRELVRASRVDPARLDAAGRRLLDRLAGARSLRVRHPNGTDLSLALARARPIVDAGRPGGDSGTVWSRVPAGLLVLPLDPRSVQGTFESNRPAFDRFVDPPVATGGRFEFDAGRLVGFEFERGGEPFAAAHARAGRGGGRATALTIGLNPAIDRAPESAELARGTVGLLLGDAPFVRGSRASGFSFLATLAGAELLADGRRWAAEGRTARPDARDRTTTYRSRPRTPAPSSARGRSGDRRSVRR